MATHDVAGRILASLGQGGPVASRFEPCADVPKAGVLLALPALLASGLWQHTEKHFQLPAGYYQLVHLFLLVAFLALARVKSLESLRYCAPGEWGKVLGLDRIPEVRTLREKLEWLGQEDKVAAWAAQLSRQWMAEDPASAGTLYVDGHVRVSHGAAARLPKHYVSRQRLCLRATTDYWINAMDGQPFFVVHRPVDPGLLQVLETEIIPRLEREVPNQPSAEALAADPTLDKFILVFDREGYSPEALKRFKERRMGCLTFHKHPGPDWPVEEFKPVKVTLAHGNEEELRLAERLTVLSNGFSVREIRHLPLGQVPQAERFDRLSSGSKDLVDTIKLVAYRAETAMAHVLRAALPKWRQQEERRLLQSLYASEADLIPDPGAATLTVRIHYPANALLGRAVEQLCAELTATETVFPTTSLRLIDQLADGGPAQGAQDRAVATAPEMPSPDDKSEAISP